MTRARFTVHYDKLWKMWHIYDNATGWLLRGKDGQVILVRSRKVAAKLRDEWQAGQAVTAQGGK